jgi:hypothetical protein
MTSTRAAVGERDAGVARTRRVTVATALLATGLAGGTAAVAALTLPGKSVNADTGTQQPAAQPGVNDGGAQAQPPVDNGGGFQGQAPDPGYYQQPVVQSGSS